MLTGSSFLHVEAETVFDTPAQLREQVVGSALSLALAAVVGTNLGGAGNIGYAVVEGALFAVCFGAVFRCAFDPQRHAAWLAPGTRTLRAFLVATGALLGAGSYMINSVDPDRYGSGEWLPLYIAGGFITAIVVRLLLYGVVLFRAHADERRGLFFTVVAVLFFDFLSCVGQGSPYTWLYGLGFLLYLLTLFVGVPVCILKIDKAHTTGARARSSGPPSPSREERKARAF